MKISAQAKAELSLPVKACCRRARFAALLRTAGSLTITSNGLSVMLSTDNQAVADYASEYIMEKYALTVSVVKGTHIVVTIEGKDVKRILVENGVLTVDSKQESGIVEYIIKGSCCVREYVKGAFLGCGFLSSDCKHLEFAFSSYDIASEFQHIISTIVPNCGQSVRADKHIVYYSNKTSVAEILAYLGASKSALMVMNSIALGDVRRKSNARSNCDMANIDRQLSASGDHLKSIEIIDENVGLENLDEKLSTVAYVRKGYPYATLAELAEMLGLSKAGVNHRLNKLNNIAKKYTDIGDK